MKRIRRTACRVICVTQTYTTRRNHRRFSSQGMNLGQPDPGLVTPRPTTWRAPLTDPSLLSCRYVLGNYMHCL
ncbi:hypothetical protein BJX65DRAFT_261492, partial [Aspergillus insuetus]